MGDHRRRLPVGAAVTPAVLPPVIVLRGHRNAVTRAPQRGHSRKRAAKWESKSTGGKDRRRYRDAGALLPPTGKIESPLEEGT